MEITPLDGTLPRRTLQWSKDVNRSMERMALYAAYHNFFKRFRIKEKDDVLHGQAAGIDRRSIEQHKRRFFTRRYHFSQLALQESEWRTWYGTWKTPVKDFRVAVPKTLAA